MSVDFDDIDGLMDNGASRHESALHYWQTLQAGRKQPSIADLTPEQLNEYKSHSFLIAIVGQGVSPVVSFAGREIFAGADQPHIKAGTSLDSVARDSLLFSLEDLFAQILENGEPLQFNVDNVGNDVATVGGVLLPFGHDGVVQFVWGVIADPVVAMDGFDEENEEDEGHAPPPPPSDPIPDDMNEFDDSDPSDAVMVMGFDDYADSFEDEAYHLSDITTNERSDLGTGKVPKEKYLGFDDRADTFEDEAYELSHVVTDEGSVVFYDEGSDFDLGTEPDEDDGFAGSIAETGEENEFDGLGHAEPNISVFDDEISDPSNLEETEELLTDEFEEEFEEETEEESAEEADDQAINQPIEDIKQEAGLDDDVAFFGVLADGRTAADGVVHVDQRSRLSLYDVLAKAYALYEESVSDRQTYLSILRATGINEQARAPFTPIIKLVFGKDFDKTRITEYAAALSYAHRKGQTSETVSAFLSNHQGGIKGCVHAERRAKRKAKGITGDATLENAKEKLRKAKTLAKLNLKTKSAEEFVLLMARKNSDSGEMEIVKLWDEKSQFVDQMIKKSIKQNK